MKVGDKVIRVGTSETGRVVMVARYAPTPNDVRDITNVNVRWADREAQWESPQAVAVHPDSLPVGWGYWAGKT